MSNANAQIDVQGTLVRVIKIDRENYICLTDIASLKNPVEPKDVVKNWMRSRASISFLGLWEKLHNPNFKGVDFDPLLQIAGDNAFTMSPTRWIEAFNARGIYCKKGRNKELYLIGASLKDLGLKCFGFTKMDAVEIRGVKERVGK